MSRPKQQRSGATKKRSAANAGLLQGSSKINAKRSRNHNAPASAEGRRDVRSNEAVQVPPAPSPTVELPGMLYAFGQNDCGQIGLNPETVEKRKFPALCDLFRNTNQNVTSVAAGGMHSVILTGDGRVFTFGCNDEGALGRLVDPDRSEQESGNPGQVTLPGIVTSISAGSSHSSALLENGSVYVWGTFRDANGHYGLLPEDGYESNPKCHKTPVKLQLDGTIHVRAIASGNDHMVLLTDTGKVLTFGASLDLLGRPVRCTRRTAQIDEKRLNLTPTEVLFGGRKKFKDIWCGSSTTFCREDSTSGTIWTFGMNSMQQLGVGILKNVMVESPIKAKVVTEKNFVHISVGEFHCLGLTADGKVFAWGKPYEGQLGLGENNPSSPTSVPQFVPGLPGRAIAINCGHSVSFALMENSELYAWGFGENWQLGNGTTDDSETPKVVFSNIRKERASTVRTMSAGAQHVLLVAEFGIGMGKEIPMEIA